MNEQTKWPKMMEFTVFNFPEFVRFVRALSDTVAIYATDDGEEIEIEKVGKQLFLASET